MNERNKKFNYICYTLFGYACRIACNLENNKTLFANYTLNCEQWFDLHRLMSCFDMNQVQFQLKSILFVFFAVFKH